MSGRSLIDVAEFMAPRLMHRPEWLPQVASRRRWVEITHAFVAACGATVVEGTRTPVYFPKEDVIGTPSLAMFILRHPWRPHRKYCIGLLHELGHWSGHEKRLGRPLHREWGDHTYMKEELAAEMTSVLLAWDLGICKRPTVASSRYLHGWLAGLPHPSVALETAFNRATTASGYLKALARQRGFAT